MTEDKERVAVIYKNHPAYTVKIVIDEPDDLVEPDLIDLLKGDNAEEGNA